MLEEHADALDFTIIRWRVLVNVFRASPDQIQAYEGVHELTHTAILDETVASGLTAQVCREVQSRTADLVSFSESIVDENIWERPANPILTQQPQGTNLRATVEVSFFTLVKQFVGQAYLTAILGSEFLEVFPSFLQNLSDFDAGWKYLAAGFPRWLPIRQLTKAHLARRHLLNAMKCFHAALDAQAVGGDPERPWRDLSDVSTLMQERSTIWRQHSISRSMRASADLALLWT